MINKTALGKLKFCTMANKPKISASMLHKISLEIANGRPLWALVMLNCYDDSVALGALRKLANRRIPGRQLNKMSNQALEGLSQGRCISELNGKCADRIKALERRCRLKEVKRMARVRERNSANYLTSLINKDTRINLTLVRSRIRQAPERNRLNSRLFKGEERNLEYNYP